MIHRIVKISLDLASNKLFFNNLESVGTENLPSRSDFVSMKEDLAFREGEVAKSKQTLEGLAAEQNQLKINLEKIEALEEKIKAEMDTLKGKMSNMNEELRTFSDLDRLRAEAAEKRQLLESEHLSLGTRKTASIQDANSVQANLDLVIFSSLCFRGHLQTMWKNVGRLSI